MRRAALFIGIILLSGILPWWLVLPLWGAYALGYTAYELIVLGVLMDAYFGYSAGALQLFYAIAGVGICIAAELLKPRIAWYSDRI